MVIPSASCGLPILACKDRRICQSALVRCSPAAAASRAAAGSSPCAQSRSPASPVSETMARPSVTPRPWRRRAGSMTFSPAGPSTGSVGSRCPYPASSPSCQSSRLRARGSPRYRRCSMTCCDKGLTPSSSAARCTRSSTAAASSAGSGPLTRTSPRGLLERGWLSPGWLPPGWLPVRMRRPCRWHARHGFDAVHVSPFAFVEHRRAAVRRAAFDRDEPVADVPDRADQRLVLRAKLRAQAPHVHVDSPGAAEVVVTPDLLQQLRPGEDPAGMLGQELQQLEFLEGQVERATVHPGRIGRLVHHQAAGADLVRQLRC